MTRWEFPKLSTISTRHIILSVVMMVVVSGLEGAIAGVFLSQVDYRFVGNPDPLDQTSNHLNYTFSGMNCDTSSSTLNSTLTPNTNNSRSIMVYLIIFILAQLFQFIIVVDALWQQNTIQVIMHDLLALCMLGYSIVQYIQLYGLLEAPCTLNVEYLQNSTLDFSNTVCNPGCQLFNQIKPIIVANIIVIGISNICFAVLTFYLYLEYGWTIFKKIGAKPETFSMYRSYEMYIMLNKVDFFFFETFSIQYLYLILNPYDPEYGLTIAAIILAVPILYLAWWAIAHENYYAVSLWLVILFGISAYYIFKIVRIYSPSQAYKYNGSSKFLTLFAALGLAVTIVQTIYTFICILNFNRGLKDYLVEKKVQKGVISETLDEIKPTSLRAGLNDSF